MWFGTQDGFNRYDAYSFKTYRHEPLDSNSLSNNYIWCLYEDKEGIFWIGTFGGGLNRFDPSTESFTRYQNTGENKNGISNNKVFSIAEYPEGTLWIATDGGLNKMDKKAGTFTHFLVNEPEPIKHINSIYASHTGELWMLCDSKLTRFDTKTGKADYFPSSPFDNGLRFGGFHSLSSANVNGFFAASDSGLYLIEPFEKRTSLIFRNTTGARIVIQDISVINKEYYIATNNGLIVFNPANNGRRVYTHNEYDRKSLTHNNIISLYYSRMGILWAGTRNGLNMADLNGSKFGLMQFQPGMLNAPSQKSISSVIKDRRGFLWLGTHEGINIYDFSRDSFSVHKDNLSSQYILSLLESKNGNIWIGTKGGGLSKAEYSKTSNIIFNRSPLKGYESSSIQALFEDKDTTLWLGTSGSGLVSLSRTGEVTSYGADASGRGPSHPFVFCIYEDSKGNLWVGTANGGLNLFDKKSKEFLYIQNDPSNPKSLSNDMVLCLYEDSNNNLWAGTAGGLNKLNIKLEERLFDKFKNLQYSPSFTKYGTSEGLPNEIIYGILGDNMNNLWFSTNKGLVRLNEGVYGKHNITAYDISDGLQSNEFNQNSHFSAGTGEMFFGGVNGVNYFHPTYIHEGPAIFPVEITDCKILNDPYNSVSKEEEVKKLIPYRDKLSFSYDDKVISFEFAGLNYGSPSKTHYAYMLEGFDNEWVYSGTRRTATYTNLDPGEYVFKVQASNGDIWADRILTKLHISIPPPPWLSWYAYLAYALLFAGGVFLTIKLRVRAATKELENKAKIENAKVMEREIVRKKSSADFHDEAGNKITKISLFTELAKREAGNSPVSEYLQKIEENTKELSSGMRDFIWVLDPAKDSLFDTMSRIKEFGDSIFDYTGVNFTATGINESLDKCRISMDSRRALVLIFKEAINNTVKYSEAKNVNLNVRVDEDSLTIDLNDDGKGFCNENVDGGYGIRNMKERAQKLKAHVDIKSAEGAGTKVTFEAKITRLGN